MEDYIESTVNAEPEVNVEPQEEEINDTQSTEQEQAEESEKEEVAEPQKPVQSAEENSKFAAIRREAEAKAAEKAEQQFNAQIAEIYGEFGITTIGELKERMREQREEEELQELLSSNIPEEYAKEMIESRRDRAERAAEKKAQQERENQIAQYEEFRETFGDIKPEDIPAEVWQIASKGKDLTSAYAIYQAKNLSTVKTQAQQEAIKAMKQNADSSTGSVNARASSDESGMSVQQVNDLLNAMPSTERTKWIDANYGNLEKWGYFKKF